MLSKFKKNLLKNETLQEENIDSSILLVEDDLDQMDLLVGFALSEITKLINNDNTNDEQKQQLKSIQIIKVSDIKSLEQVVSIHKGVFFTILDCNIPDSKESDPHDQFVKTNHRITGQHKSVDLVIENLPNTAVTIISSMNRFQKTVTKYYKKTNNRHLNFISKSDGDMINKNIGYYLRKHIQ